MSDVISSPEGVAYEIVDRLGHGTFGQVLKCSTRHDREIALKVIKNKPAYFQQGLIEVKILQLLNQSYDLRVVKMFDYFVYRKHLCIVFELLSVNLYDVIKHNSFRGLPFNMVRSIVDQLARVLVCLKLSNVIHCDLKPENILLTTKKNTKIKLIDFGSAAFQGQQIYTYIQSRFYRSTDVILGILPFTPAIDMWSLGCILAELYLGLPLFPGHSEYDQLVRIIELLGPIPPSVLDRGKNTRKFFSKSAPNCYVLRSREEYEQVTGKKEKVGARKSPPRTNLGDLILNAPSKDSSNGGKILSFIALCLEYDPDRRLTPGQAISHPLFEDSATMEGWKPRSDETSLKRLTDDPNSFVHHSSSAGATGGSLRASFNSSTLSADMMSTPLKQTPSHGNTPLKQTPVKYPLQARNSQFSSSSVGAAVVAPDDSMPLSYRPVIQMAPSPLKKFESPTTVVRHKLPGLPPCSPPGDLVVKWV